MHKKTAPNEAVNHLYKKNNLNDYHIFYPLQKSP